MTTTVARARIRLSPRVRISWLTGPGRQFERTLVRRTVVQRLAVRDDHVLERQVEQRAERREHARLVPRRPPDEELAGTLRQRVGEDERPLLGEPERRLVAPASVIERLETAGQYRARFDRLEVGFRDVGAPEEVRPERTGAVPADEEVDVPNVIRLEDDGKRRRARVQPLPDLARLRGRRHGVEHRDLVCGCDAGRRHHRLPTGFGAPVWILDPPQPEAGSDVEDLALHRVAAGWNNSIGLPDGSSKTICEPPGPRTMSLRNAT